MKGSTKGMLSKGGAVAAKQAPLGEGGRFAALSAKIAKRGGKKAKNPDAIAAAIGRAKYGKVGFQKLAAKGRAEKY